MSRAQGWTATVGLWFKLVIDEGGTGYGPPMDGGVRAFRLRQRVSAEWEAEWDVSFLYRGRLGWRLNGEGLAEDVLGKSGTVLADEWYYILLMTRPGREVGAISGSLALTRDGDVDWSPNVMGGSPTLRPATRRQAGGDRRPRRATP